jgi:zinc transporter, ZIP family
MWSLYAFAILAGVSAYLGILLARGKWLSGARRAWVTAVALGIIVFVMYDVLTDALVLLAGRATVGGYPSPLSLGFLIAGVVGGFGILVGIGRLVTRPSPERRRNGLLAISERPPYTRREAASIPLPIVVAAGIGAHGLFEGFAVGAAFATGVLSAALVLVLGMCLHKVGEGVCICGCSVTTSNRYTSAQLAGLGLLAGAPIFLGIVTGNFVAAIPLISILSYGAALGIMAYVAIQLGRAVLSERENLSIAIAGGTLGLMVSAVTTILINLGSA